MHLFSMEDTTCRGHKTERPECRGRKPSQLRPLGGTQKTLNTPEGTTAGAELTVCWAGPQGLCLLAEPHFGRKGWAVTGGGCAGPHPAVGPSGCHRSQRAAFLPLRVPPDGGASSRPQPHTDAHAHTQRRALCPGSSVPSSFYFMFLDALNRWELSKLQFGRFFAGSLD